MQYSRVNSQNPPSKRKGGRIIRNKITKDQNSNQHVNSQHDHFHYSVGVNPGESRLTEHQHPIQ